MRTAVTLTDAGHDVVKNYRTLERACNKATETQLAELLVLISEHSARSTTRAPAVLALQRE